MFGASEKVALTSIMNEWFDIIHEGYSYSDHKNYVWRPIETIIVKIVKNLFSIVTENVQGGKTGNQVS